jgi:hypothetical protein
MPSKRKPKVVLDSVVLVSAFLIVSPENFIHYLRSDIS